MICIWKIDCLFFEFFRGVSAEICRLWDVDMYVMCCEVLLKMLTFCGELGIKVNKEMPETRHNLVTCLCA